MNIKGLEALVNQFTEIIARDQGIPRRDFGKLMASGPLAAFLAGCATGTNSGGLFTDPRYYFLDGGGVGAHRRSGIMEGKDWYTGHETLVTAMAEGRVSIAERFIPRRSFDEQYRVRIQHFGGRWTEYWELTEKFVNPGDYCGKNTIIGKGGSHTRHSDGTTGKRHIHINHLIQKYIFDASDLRNSDVERPTDKPFVRADPEAGGLALWDGTDTYSRYAERNEYIAGAVRALTANMPEDLRKVVDAMGNPSVRRIIYLLQALDGDLPWLQSSDRDKVRSITREYVNLAQPLNLPFVNPELYKMNGVYQQGSTARTEQEFKRQYPLTLSLIKDFRLQRKALKSA